MKTSLNPRISWLLMFAVLLFGTSGMEVLGQNKSKKRRQATSKLQRKLALRKQAELARKIRNQKTKKSKKTKKAKKTKRPKRRSNNTTQIKSRNDTRHFGNGHDGGKGSYSKLSVNANAVRLPSGRVSVGAIIRDRGQQLPGPLLKLDYRRRAKTTWITFRGHRYRVQAFLHMNDSRVFVAVVNYRKDRIVGKGTDWASIRRNQPTPDPVVGPGPPPPAEKQFTYVVRTYHPLTKKQLTSQSFVNRAGALDWYNNRRKNWWVFVYSTFESKPKEYRGSKTVCQNVASNAGRDLLQTARAVPPRVTFTTLRR